MEVEAGAGGGADGKASGTVVGGTDVKASGTVAGSENRVLVPEQVMNGWNYYIKQYKAKGFNVQIKPMRRLTENRRELIQGVIDRYRSEDIKMALMNLMTSDYCNGRKKDRAGKPAQVEWVFGDEDRFQKLIEGSYN